MNLQSENLPYWKSIWLTCSGVQQTTARDAVKKDLNDWKDFFLVGLHQFKSQQSEDNHNIKKKPNINEKLWDFVKRLSSFLDVTTDLAWSIITQYLLCEFHGTPTTLQNLTLTYDTSSKLLRDIWYFYTSERMFYLKTLKFILEYHTDVNHPYRQEFAEFIEDCNLTVFRESLISQLKLLISVNINSSDDMNAEMHFLWIKRNLQEQIEILQCISLTHKTNNITPEEFISLLELFSCHRFGTQPIYFNETALIPQHLQRRLTDCEIALLLCILDSTLVKKNVEKWDTSIKKDVDNWITRLSNEFGDDLSSIVLSWMLIRFNIKFKPNKDIVTATLKQLRVLVTSTTFKDKSQASIIFRKSVYNLLHLIRNRESEEGNEEVYTQCLSQVLKDSETAEHYWKEQDEQMSIPREKWFFPTDFNSYSLVANGLALADNNSYNKVLEETHKMPGICIPFSQSVAKCLVRKNNIYYFRTNYCVINKQSIPEGSVCILEPEHNPKTVHVQCESNYWVVFSHLLSMCIKSVRGGGKSHFKEVENGLQFWLTILNNIKSKNQLTNDLVKPLNNTFELFNELLLKRNTNTKVYALIIEIMAALHKISVTDDICERLRQYSFFPVLVDSYLPFEQLVKPTNFIQGRIFELILDYEIIHNKYYLLEAYLKFLRVRFEKNKGDFDAFEIPGIIFILQDILPKFSDWRFDISSPEQTILYNSISLLFDILRESSGNKNNNFQILQKICIFDLLHITNGKVILNIVARGNRYLELIMQSETNWVSGEVIQYLHIVQMSLTILMLLFQKKSLITSRENDMPLEVLMFTQPKEEDTLQIIRNIASYMDHIFHKQLPVLSCRILRKFALKIQISLHGCFDMDSDQIRHVFIHRLRNKEESNDLKIAILDFIIACVKKQPGLTQTFFSKSSLEENNKTDEESLLSLMEEFLDLMSSETEFLGDPTLRSMMSLFHELWKNQKQVVVSVMRNSDKFWNKLCSPLKFKIITSLIKSYSQIFNIISIELYMTIYETDANLKAVVKNILNPNEIYFERWINYIFKENISSKIRNNSQDVENNCPHWLSLLQSWKDFMNIIINRYPNFMEPKAKSMMGHACLKALVDQINIMEDSRVITVLSELYILMLGAWRESIFDNRTKTIQYLAKIVLLTHNSHRAWHRRIRSAVLSITVCMTRLLKDEIKLNEDYAIKIFNSSCKLACDELNSLETYHRSPSTTMEVEKKEMDTELSTQQESILKINLLNEILIVCHDMTDLYRSCVHMKLCLRLVQCLESIVQIKHLRPITLTILDCVMHLVKTRYADEFLSCELSLKLWLKVLPPKELMLKNRDPFNETLWTTDEWWPLYQRVILIVGLLLRKLQSRFLEDALLFVVIHEGYLIECLSLIRQSIDLNALNVVESTVTFICEIMQFQKQWKPYHAESYIQIIKALTTGLYCTIALLLRPNHIQSYKYHDNTSNADDPISQTRIIDILNKLVDLVTKITQVLLKQSPPLMTLLCNHNSFMEPSSIILDLEFNLPNLRNDDDVELSFGTIMAAINLLSRALQQIYIDESKNENTGIMSRSQLSPRKRLGPSITSNSTKINSNSDFTDLYPSSPSVNISNTSWFRHLDKNKSIRALEVMLSLLASQTLIYLFDKQEPRKNRQLICREISSELGVFHEYVKLISRGWSSRGFEDYSIIPRIKLGCSPIHEKVTIEPRDLSLQYYEEEFNPYTLEKTMFSDLRKQIVDVYLKNSRELIGSQSDGDPIVILSKVKFDFPDYFIFISNLFVSICKREEY